MNPSPDTGFGRRYNLRSSASVRPSAPIRKPSKTKPHRRKDPETSHAPPPRPVLPQQNSKTEEEAPPAARLAPAEDGLKDLEAALLTNWYWNIYQSIGLTVESEQSEVESALRDIRKKCHPDKRKGAEHIYARADALHRILVAGRNKYRKMLQSTYVPHGGGLLDEAAMEAYLSNKRCTYAPKKLVCVLPETGPRFVAKPPRAAIQWIDKKSDYQRTRSVFGH